MRYRLSDEDRARYGGPEWLDLEDIITWSTDAAYDALVAAEKQITALLGDPDKGLTWVVAQYIANTRTAALIPMQRIRIWLGLLAGGVDIKLADCKPKVLAGELRYDNQDGGDADPPPPGVDSSDITASEPSSPESETSTESSTPGSLSTTE